MEMELARANGFRVRPGHAQHGEHALVECPNGWQASVVRGAHTYGGAPWLFELAVFRPDAAIARGAEALCYDTPITSSMIGYLSESDVVRVLRLIAELPPWEDPVTPPSKEAYDAFAKAHAEELEWLNGR